MLIGLSAGLTSPYQRLWVLVSGRRTVQDSSPLQGISRHAKMRGDVEHEGCHDRLSILPEAHRGISARGQMHLPRKPSPTLSGLSSAVVAFLYVS